MVRGDHHRRAQPRAAQDVRRDWPPCREDSACRIWAVDPGSLAGQAARTGVGRGALATAGRGGQAKDAPPPWTKRGPASYGRGQNSALQEGRWEAGIRAAYAALAATGGQAGVPDGIESGIQTRLQERDQGGIQARAEA